jgi:hypothetical protein
MTSVSVNGDGFEYRGLVGAERSVPTCSARGKTRASTAAFDGTTLELGAGWSHGFSDTLDFDGTLSYVDSGDRGRRHHRQRRRLGARRRHSQPSRRVVRARGGLKYVDLDESGSDTGLQRRVALLLQRQHGARREPRSDTTRPTRFVSAPLGVLTRDLDLRADLGPIGAAGCSQPAAFSFLRAAPHRWVY